MESDACELQRRCTKTRKKKRAVQQTSNNKHGNQQCEEETTPYNYTSNTSNISNNNMSRYSI